MRGYGRSTVYSKHEDYAQELIVADMIGLLDSLGRKKAVWVGHDWGSPVVWNIASHHPDRCEAIASLCVPYWTLERGLEHIKQYINRDIYPADKFPSGQWEYQEYYLENFADAVRSFEKDPYITTKALFRKGNPEIKGKPTGTAMVRIEGGWRGGGDWPDVPRDVDVVTEADLATYSAFLKKNGFFGPDSW